MSACFLLLNAVHSSYEEEGRKFKLHQPIVKQQEVTVVKTLSQLFSVCKTVQHLFQLDSPMKSEIYSLFICVSVLHGVDGACGILFICHTNQVECVVQAHVAQTELSSGEQKTR